jgi:predicted GNAT family N-acyltransferase
MNFKIILKNIIFTGLLKIYFPNVTFREIKTEEELEKMYKLVWEVYALEKKWIDPSQFSIETLKDEYETNSIKIGAFKNKDLLGTIRIILPSSLHFYVEKDFNVEFPEFFQKEKTAELSRLVVLKKYRNKLISFGLFKKAFKISKKIGIKYWVVVIKENMKDYFSKHFRIKLHPIKLNPLTEKHLEIRKKMENYYKTENPLPYLISLEEILK